MGSAIDSKDLMLDLIEITFAKAALSWKTRDSKGFQLKWSKYAAYKSPHDTSPGLTRSLSNSNAKLILMLILLIYY